MPKGIKIIEHKNWNTKKVYSRSGLQITYDHCPKKLFFKNKMVNDGNQHLCNGWSYFKNDEVEIWKRLKKGKKPMGTFHFWMADEKKALAMYNEVKKDKDFHSHWAKKNGTIEILVAVRGKMKDLFDLDALIKDYAACDLYIEDEVKAVANKEIKAFFKVWDKRSWLTGLILGYPIENTISLMTGHAK